MLVIYKHWKFSIIIKVRIVLLDGNAVGVYLANAFAIKTEEANK